MHGYAILYLVMEKMWIVPSSAFPFSCVSIMYLDTYLDIICWSPCLYNLPNNFFSNMFSLVISHQMMSSAGPIVDGHLSKVVSHIWWHVIFCSSPAHTWWFLWVSGWFPSALPDAYPLHIPIIPWSPMRPCGCSIFHENATLLMRRW